MLVRSVFFRRDGYVYTLFSQARLPTYLVKWEPQSSAQRLTWKQDVTAEVHPRASTGMQRSRHGQICVLSSDGFVTVVDCDTLRPVFQPRKLGSMPITSAVYYGDDMLITGSADYCYNLLPLNTFSALNALRNLVIQIALLLLLILFAVDFFVDDDFRGV